MGLVFYDTETTGLNTAYDQILQFAAIHTDHELNPIERFEVECRIQQHIVPSPKALLLNGVAGARLYDTSLPSHYQMMRSIHSKLTEWSPANFVGFNSMSFDEHLLRQALFQTLHPPYLTNRAGNGRSDVLRMLHAASVLAPGSVSVPLGENGRPTFGLSSIAAANGFTSGRAHDAMADVNATLFLARLLMEKASEVWSMAMRFAQKTAVTEYILNEPVFCAFEHFHGGPHAWLTTHLSINPENSSECFLYDLSIDPAELLTLDEAALTARVAEFPKPVRLLKTNAAPILMASYEAPAIATGLELGEAELTRRAEAVSADASFKSRLIAAYQAGRKERAKSKHPEGQLYDTFIPDADIPLLEAFHASPWVKRPTLLRRLSDGRLRKLGRRLIYFEHPELLDEPMRTKYDGAIARRILGADPDTEWFTLPEALAEIGTLLLSDGTASHLAEHSAILEARLAEAQNQAEDAMAPYQAA